MESEYVALSQACKDLLPLENLVREVAHAVQASEGAMMDVKTSIWEDNEPCKKLANMELPRMTNRSKHFAIDYHWFREYVGVRWTVNSISTHDQLADIMTKSTSRDLFEKFRFRIMGW